MLLFQLSRRRECACMWTIITQKINRFLLKVIRLHTRTSYLKIHLMLTSTQESQSRGSSWWANLHNSALVSRSTEQSIDQNCKRRTDKSMHARRHASESTISRHILIVCDGASTTELYATRCLPRLRTGERQPQW